MKEKIQITKKWFKSWSNEFDQSLGSMSFHKGLLRLMVESSGVKNNSRILDIGCGTGLLSINFLSKRNCSIVGIDNSKDMLLILNKKIKKFAITDNLKVQYMDISKLDFKANSFDIVTSSMVLHHFDKDKLKLLKKIKKVLKPGGLFILGDIDMDTRGLHTDTKRLKKIVEVLLSEWVCALTEVGTEAFKRMYDNGKKHILNIGEFCVSFNEWAALCKKAGLKIVKVLPVKENKHFKVLVAKRVK
ncbi:MAG: class I SAM-dependent methyltransferase [Candidatus Gygaella obscura]|nr:class I SAM-dependent methyltransferase [Candidatus Gygaella obscura]